MLLELGCGFIELLGSIIMYGGVSMAFLMSSLSTSAADVHFYWKNIYLFIGKISAS
jgi:hypothetical protein